MTGQFYCSKLVVYLCYETCLRVGLNILYRPQKASALLAVGGAVLERLFVITNN